jgi:hypothetical protein
VIVRISGWLQDNGFTPERDLELYEYAARWMSNNSLLAPDAAAALFADSAGVAEYRATGHVTPDED